VLGDNVDPYAFLYIQNRRHDRILSNEDWYKHLNNHDNNDDYDDNNNDSKNLYIMGIIDSPPISIPYNPTFNDNNTTNTNNE
jgi:hypothetical protein